MEGQLLSLKWENHKNSFYQALTSIRKNSSYYDVTIICGHKTYKAHKLVLSTCSEYLEEVLERTALTNSLVIHPVIVLHDIQSHYLEALLDYMYVGEVDVLQTDLPGLIKAAEWLKVKGLAVPDSEPSKNSKGRKRSLEEQDQDRKKNRTGNSITDGNKQNYHIIKEDTNDISSVKSIAHNIKSEDKNSPSSSETLHTQSDSSFSHLRNEGLKFDNTKEIVANQNSQKIKEEIELDYTEELFTETNPDSNEYYNYEYDHSSGQEAIDPELDLLAQGYPADETNSGFTSTTNFSQQDVETFEDQNQDMMNISYTDGLASNIQENHPPMDANEVWIRAGRSGPGQGVTCPYCMKVFTRKSIFIYHYKTHTGEKPFACSHCPRRFIQKGNMESHARTHIKEKSSKCPQCPQIFSQKVYLLMHMNEVHKQHTMT